MLGIARPAAAAVRLEFTAASCDGQLGRVERPPDATKLATNPAVSPMLGRAAHGRMAYDVQGGRRFNRVGKAQPAERTGDIPLYRH